MILLKKKTFRLKVLKLDVTDDTSVKDAFRQIN